MRKPLMFDLFCGLGGATDGFLAEGWDCIGIDIERHQYGDHRYPAQLWIQDILTISGAQLRDADFLWASPPCQTYSWMAMPWKRAKAKAAAIRADTSGKMLADLNRLFYACFRIQKEASFAAGRHVPMVVENVRGAQPWVGRARWNFGSFYLWGDVPALMPFTAARGVMKTGIAHRPDGVTNFHGHTKNNGGSWFNVAHNTTSGKGRNPDRRRVCDCQYPEPENDGVAYVSNECPIHNLHPDPPPVGVKVASAWGRRTDPGKGARFTSRDCGVEGTKNGNDWFGSGDDCSLQLRASSNSPQRKFASAMIAKIPLSLSRHIAATYRPAIVERDVA